MRALAAELAADETELAASLTASVAAAAPDEMVAEP
jgi:hypothetical protein